MAEKRQPFATEESIFVQNIVCNNELLKVRDAQLLY
jgi:hypothetical protein